MQLRRGGGVFVRRQIQHMYVERRLCAQRMFVTMSSNITNMYLNDEH